MGKNLVKNGELKPANNYQAHHIILQGAKDSRMDQLRNLVTACPSQFPNGIDDAQNGLWLRVDLHNRIHTGNYKTHIFGLLEAASLSGGGCPAIKQRLADIKVDIKSFANNGDLPPWAKK